MTLGQATLGQTIPITTGAIYTITAPPGVTTGFPQQDDPSSWSNVSTSTTAAGMSMTGTYTGPTANVVIPAGWTILVQEGQKPPIQVSGVTIVVGLIGAAFIGWVGGKIADKVFGGALERTKRIVRRRREA